MIEPKTLLRDARKRLKMTQAAMADHLHIKQATVSLYEGGKVEPSVEILMRLERLVESEPDLRSALVQQVNNRIRSMTPQQVDEDLPIYITDVAPPFSEFVRDLIARLKTISAPPGLIKMLRLYLRTNNAAEMWPLFAKAADYIEVELTRASAQKAPGNSTTEIAALLELAPGQVQKLKGAAMKRARNKRGIGKSGEKQGGGNAS